MYNHMNLIIAIFYSIMLNIAALSGYPAWGIVLIFVIILFNLELGAHPITQLVGYIHLQITLRRERIQRRRNYELFKAGTKSGLFTTDEQIEDENRRVVK